MFRLAEGAPRTALALGVVVLLALGCAQTDASKIRASTQAGKTAPAPSPAPSPMLTLDAEQQRRAEALAQYATGVSLELNGGLDKALEYYQRAFELDPENTVLAVRLAQIFVSRKDFLKSVSILETAGKATPNSPEPWFWLGVVRKMSDHSDKAIVAFRQGLKLDPTHLGSVQALLEIFLQQDSLAEAARTLDTAWRQKSTTPTYWLRLGDLWSAAIKQTPSLAKHTDRSRIQQCYEKALALSPDEPEIVHRLAEMYVDMGEYQKAADAYGKLLAKKPDAPQIRERLALSYIRADRKEEATAVLEEIIRREPLRFEIYNYLAEIYEDLDRDERAISNYKQSLVVNPNQLPPYLRLALLQLKHKQHDAALQTLEGAKEKFPTAYHVPYYYGLLYSDRKDYSQAVSAFGDAEALALEAPEEVKLDSSFYFYYGAACERSGDIDKAAALFRKSIELDPEKHAAYNYLGFMWADKGIHLNEALDLIKKAIAKEPDNGAYVDSLGWVLYRLGRYEEALVHLRRAAELITTDAVVFDHLADVLLKLGKQEEALTYLRRALELEPENAEIGGKLQKLITNRSVAH